MSIYMSRRCTGFRTRPDLPNCGIVGITLLLVLFSVVCSFVAAAFVAAAFVAAVAAEHSSPETYSVTRWVFPIRQGGFLSPGSVVLDAL